MSFSAKQVQALQRGLHPSRVKIRENHQQQLSYIEGWYAIAEANRIFGFDGWSRETLESKCVFSRENRGSFTAVYTAKVRITVYAGSLFIVREGHGTGEGCGNAAGSVHDIALKAAETDATKRALATFGSRFGLMLYDRSRTRSRKRSHKKPATPSAPSAPEAEAVESPDFQAENGERRETPHSIDVEKIDKSLLMIGAPKRLRNRDHLRYVATQACLICGRRPSDAHHLKFTQPRALGLKVSDEFTVPLCRGHHRELHSAGDEQRWWAERNIDAVSIADAMWQLSQKSDGRSLP